MRLLKKIKVKLTEIVVISVMLYLLGCTLEDPHTIILAEDIISLRSDRDSLEADGQNTFILTAELLERTDPNKEITFRTSYGTFTNGNEPGTQKTTIKSSGRTAKAILKVTNITEGRIFVSAELSGYASDLELKTISAFPTVMIVNPTDLILKKDKGNIVSFSINLRRNVGKVSNDVPISFSFKDAVDKNMLLLFNPLAFSKDGSAVITLQSLNNSVGSFSFRAATPINDKRDSIYHEILMKVE